MSDHNIPLDKLARVYLKLREQIDVVNKEYEEKLNALKERQDLLRDEMREMLKELGVKSVRTDEGTVMMQIKTRYSTNDWDAFKQFAIEHDAIDLYEKRIHQSNMRLFLEEHPEQIPPGLNADSSYEISVRRPTK